MTIHSLVIQKLLTTNAHMGRRAAADHFKKYAYGIRNGQTIIDSDKTLICLRNACNFISILAQNPKSSFMFINTNPLFQEIVDIMSAKITSMNPNRTNTLWRMGGFLTNSFSPKKFRSRNKKVCFGPTKLPDCLVVFDTERKSSAVLEADRLRIPIVALVDPSMPWDFYQKITYPVPANDSVKFVYLFCNMITKCFMLEKKKKEAGVDRIGKKASTGQQAQIEQSKTSRAKDEVLVIPYDNLEPISEDTAEAKKHLEKLVVIKFSRGLSTDIGFSGPRSLIEVRKGSTSLDLIVKQIQSLNSWYGCHIPLLLLSTSETHSEIAKELEKYSNSNVDIHSVNQGVEPKQDVLDEHGGEDKLYQQGCDVALLSIVNGGTLDLLLSQGKEYALVIDTDNVAAVVDPKILNHMTQNNTEYCIEVTPTLSSAIGNIMASSLETKVKLADIALHPARQLARKSKFIDTRSLWVNLKALKRLVGTDAPKMEDLLNSKVDADAKYSAAGSAIQLFNQAIGVNVPRSRFLTVNSTSDLLLLQSDLYTSVDGVLVRDTARTNPKDPSIDLGPEFENLNDFQSRFKSMPSIIGLDSLKVAGDVWFGAKIILKGKVSIVAKPGTKLEIPDGAVLKDQEINDIAGIQANYW